MTKLDVGALNTVAGGASNNPLGSIGTTVTNGVQQVSAMIPGTTALTGSSNSSSRSGRSCSQGC